MHPLIHAFGEKPLQSRRTGQTAWQWMFCYSEIPVQMTLANIVYHNFFERFPNIKMVSAENGSNWLPGVPGEDGQDARHGQERLLALRAAEGAPQQDLQAALLCRRVSPRTMSKAIVEKIGTADCLRDGLGLPACRRSAGTAGLLQGGTDATWRRDTSAPSCTTMGGA